MERMIEQKRLERKLLVAGILALVSLVLIGVSKWALSPKYQELQSLIGNTASIVKDISAVETQKAKYQSMLDSTGKSFSNLIEDKDSCISMLGDITMKNNLNINKMTVDDIQSLDNGMYSMRVEIELQGTLSNIKNMVQELYNSDMVNRTNAFSYRLQSEHDLLWMWRTIDDVTLVPWWDFGTKSETIVITDETGEEKQPLGANDLMKHGQALCYLEIEFIGTGG